MGVLNSVRLPDTALRQGSLHTARASLSFASPPFTAGGLRAADSIFAPLQAAFPRRPQAPCFLSFR